MPATVLGRRYSGARDELDSGLGLPRTAPGLDAPGIQPHMNRLIQPTAFFQKHLGAIRPTAAKISRQLWLLLTTTLALGGCQGNIHSPAPGGPTERVGQTARNRYVTPANQILTPAGVQVELPGLRPQALALSPDGRLLVVSGKTAELVALDPATGRVGQRVALPSEKDLDPAPDAVFTLQQVF